VMTDWMPLSQRASGQGAVWMSSRFGGAIGPFLFAWLFNAFGLWTPFGVFTAIGLAWCAFFWMWFRNRPDEMPSVNEAERKLIESGQIATLAHGQVPWSSMLQSVNVWALCLMYGFVGFAGNFITNLLPDYLKDDRGLKGGTVTWLTSLPLAVGVVSCLCGGFLSDWITRRWGSRKWGRRFNGSTGLVLAGLALLCVPWSHSVALLGFLLCASFFCNDLNMGPAWAASADIGERYAGTIGGAMNMTGNFLGAIGMIFAGWMMEHGHNVAVFVVFGCSYTLAAACWLFVDVTKPLQFGHNRRRSEK